MTEQLALIPKTRPLTDRQERALELLREAGPAGRTGEELGTAFGAHSMWAKKTGLELARALKKKGLVRQLRGGYYAAVDADPAKTEAPAGMLRDDEEIPF